MPPEPNFPPLQVFFNVNQLTNKIICFRDLLPLSAGKETYPLELLRINTGQEYVKAGVDLGCHGLSGVELEWDGGGCWLPLWGGCCLGVLPLPHFQYAVLSLSQLLYFLTPSSWC